MRGTVRRPCAVRMLALIALLAGSSPARARIKLVTLPVRERVEIQLDNEDATLVEEERYVPLLRGTNQIDFSWANTRIDKGTVLFRVVEMPTRPKRDGDPADVVRPDGRVDMIRVINVAYPPNENALVWEVWSERPVAARVRISYLISNLIRRFSYRAVAEHDESTLVLRKYIRLTNVSGEAFGNSGIWAGFGNYFHRPVGMNEAKRMLIWKFKRVPVNKTYTFNWWTCPKVPDQPEQRYVEMRYVLRNDEQNGMGRFALQPGKVRIFQKDGRGTDAFIGEDWGVFTPLDAKMKLYLGLARDVVVRRKVTRNKRNPVRGNLYNQELIVEYQIENFKTTPVVLDVHEDMKKLRDRFCGRKGREPQWQILVDGTTLPQRRIERISSRRVDYHIPLAAAPKGEGKVEKVKVAVHVLLKNEW